MRSRQTAKVRCWREETAGSCREKPHEGKIRISSGVENTVRIEKLHSPKMILKSIWKYRDDAATPSNPLNPFNSTGSTAPVRSSPPESFDREIRCTAEEVALERRIQELDAPEVLSAEVYIVKPRPQTRRLRVSTA